MSIVVISAISESYLDGEETKTFYLPSLPYPRAMTSVTFDGTNYICEVDDALESELAAKDAEDL